MIAISTPLTAAAGAPPAALPIPRLPVCPVCRGAFDANCANCDGTGIDPAAREGHEAWRTDLEQRLGKRRKFS